MKPLTSHACTCVVQDNGTVGGTPLGAGLSNDSHFAHIAWLRTIHEKIKFKNMEHVEVTFPLIADVKMDVARTCGMVQPGASDTQAVRAVFLIDPKASIRAVIHYPSTALSTLPRSVTR